MPKRDISKTTLQKPYQKSYSNEIKKIEKEGSKMNISKAKHERTTKSGRRVYRWDLL